MLTGMKISPRLSQETKQRCLQGIEDKGVPTDDAPAANSDSSKSVVSKVIDAITGCMTPMIPALTAAGMIKVVLTLLTTFHLVSETSSTYQVISFNGDATLLHAVPDRSKCRKVFRTSHWRCLLPVLTWPGPNYGSLRCGHHTAWSTITKAIYSYSVIPLI